MKARFLRELVRRMPAPDYRALLSLNGSDAVEMAFAEAELNAVVTVAFHSVHDGRRAMLKPLQVAGAFTIDGGNVILLRKGITPRSLVTRKSFENGLPGSPLLQNIDTTSWGRIPTVQSVVHAFDNDSESRTYQDVGLDGLRDQDEQSFFSDYLQRSEALTSPDAYSKIVRDPAADDFHYFRGQDYDQDQIGILDRYKKYKSTTKE